MTYINFYSTSAKAIPINFGKKNRDWFDLHSRDLYYKVDLTTANECGWELKSPCDFMIEWDGGPNSDDTVVHTTIDNVSYFYTGLGNGICSINTGYIIETPETYGAFLTGFPNHFKDNVHTMTSLIQSDWQHIPYYVHLKMVKPGKTIYVKGEAIGFVTIVPYRQMENFETKIDTIMSNEKLYRKYNNWLNGEPMEISNKNIKLSQPKKTVDIYLQKFYNIFK